MGAPVADRWRPPAAFAEYALLHPLGRGGMGHVYLARDTLLERLVAVKFMHRHRDAVARERFVVEARAAARLSHPNVVAVFRIGEVEGRPFIVSEYVPGDSLAALATPIPWREALDVGRDLARGLAAAHAHGVLHRDIKPANAIRTTSGVVKLLDFGLAKLAAESVPPPSAPGARIPPPGQTASPSAETAPAPGMSLSGMLAATVRAGSAGAQGDTLEPSQSTLEPTREAASTLEASAAPEADEDPDRVPGPLSPTPLTRDGAVMGTPGYMSPEAWRGEPATARSDVYSLGAVLYYLCTGEAPHAGTPFAELAAVAASRDVPKVSARAPGIDPAFAAVIDRCLAREADARYESGAALLDALESIGARAAAVPEGNPYRGLLPFDAEHRALFFGRGADIRAVIERLRAAPFVLVAGHSGVGKSSLCRAGVLPLATDGGMRDDRRWEAIAMVPGRAPMTALRAALAESAGDLDAGREDRASDFEGTSGARKARRDERAREPAALAASLVRALGAGRGLLLLVDQLEELLTLSEPSQVAPFCELVAELVRAAPPGVRVLATARGDYFTRLAELPALGPAVERAFYLLRPMGRDAIREAIVGPAEAAGAAFESDELVGELAEAGMGGGLPLLQFALAQVWDARDGKRLTRKAVEQIGGVDGALARHADEVIAGMAAPVRAAARVVLLRLVTLERTRGRRTEGELVTGEAGRAAIEALVRGRLVVARDEEAGEAGYSIAHEALLTRWDTLRRWVDAADETRAIRERVSAAAAEWDKLGRSADALWRGQRLLEARRLDEAELSPVELSFVGASRGAERRGRWLRGGAAAAVLVLVAGVYFGVAAVQRRDLDRRVSEALAQGSSALARARELGGSIEEKRRGAFEAFDAGDAERGEGVWGEALAEAAKQDAAFTDAAVAVERALGLDPARHASREQMAQVLYEHAMAAERDHRGGRVHDLVQRLAVYDEGARIGQWTAPATLVLSTSPPGARLEIEEYTLDPSGLRTLGPARALPADPAGNVLPPGSYVVTIQAPGHAPVRYPVELGRGERLAVDVPLLREADVPAGFVHVPAGRFWFGSAAFEEIRKWQSAVPAHHRRTGAYLIAREETTYAQWIAFLEALPADQRDRHLPKVTSGFWGTMALVAAASGWELTLQPTQHAYVVRTGERLRYLDRDAGVEVDWTRLPVSGVSWEQASAYVAWLSETGRVPRARMCREDEWERAARGADLRIYPHGDSLQPGSADFDETYGRKKRAFGPDEVGTHPASRSPLGLDDMVGNVFELTASVRAAGEIILRGGSYYVDRPTSQATNRNVFQPADRTTDVGFRVCADVPEGGTGGR